MAERWGALPLGELHAEGRCALCGLRGELERSLKRTVLATTQAVAHVCIDSVVCERRRYNQRRRVA
jgi:hypothetical protein